MKQKFMTLMAVGLMMGLTQVASAAERDRCEVNGRESLPKMIVVRVSETEASAPEYLFSNEEMDLSAGASAEEALSSSCSGDFRPMLDSDEGAIPETINQWFNSEDQIASLPGDNAEWTRFRRFYRGYGSYGFYGYNYYYPYYGRFGIYYNNYRYPYYYRYGYPYGGYRYYYYYNPYYPYH